MTMEPLILAGHDGSQLTLPGLLWPAGVDLHGQDLFFGPMKKKQANALLAAWGTHPLGEYNRGFGYQAWGLAYRGDAIALAVSGSTVGASSCGYSRFACVDLARIANNPAARDKGVLRAMLRLWRDYLALQWAEKYWPVTAAVSYGLPGKLGNLYRFDGWKKYGTVKPSGGGGTWSKRPKTNDMADGIKTVWYYEYPHLPAGSTC